MQKTLVFTKSTLQTIAEALIDLSRSLEKQAQTVDIEAKPLIEAQAKEYKTIANSIRYFCQFSSNGIAAPGSLLAAADEQSGVLRETLVFTPDELESIARALLHISNKEADRANDTENGYIEGTRALFRKQSEINRALYNTIKNHIDDITDR